MKKRGIKYLFTNANNESIEFSDNSKIFIKSVSDLTSNDVNISEASATNQIGSNITGKSIQSKQITIDGIFKYDTNIRKRLLAVILPGIAAKFRYVNEYEGIDVYWNVEVSKSPIISDSSAWQNFQFSLRTGYPYARSNDAQFIDFNVLKPLFRFSQSYSSARPFKISSRTFQPLKTIFYKGLVSTGFKATFKALSNDIRAPYIMNVDTQEKIKFGSLTLSEGDVIEVSTFTNDVYCKLLRHNQESNIYADSDYNSTFFKFNPGDNVIRYGADSNEQNLEVRIEFEDVYPGV